MHSDERPMASEQSRLNEAVEVAIDANYAHRQSVGIVIDDRSAMRAALLAAMPLLLGPVVGHVSFSHQMGNRHYIGISPVLNDSAIETGTPLYAPDLGGGK